MSGYYKLISKDTDLAVVDIAGWACHGIVLHQRRIERLKREIEELQNHISGDGNMLAQSLWEEFDALLRISTI